MASINFDNLKDSVKPGSEFTYIDLALDLSEENVGISSNFSGQGRDIKIAPDLEAIKNSIQNIFNTAPGERFLLPEFGIDLRRYVFETITRGTAQLIGKEIYNGIVKWDSRIRVVNIDVVGVADQNEYRIALLLGIPFLRNNLNVGALLTREGFFVS